MGKSQNWIAGKQVLVTGATDGIGLAMARELARLGARVLIVSRNPEKCARIAAALRRETGNQAVDALAADLSVQAEVRALAEQVVSRQEQLHVLINNVGGFFLRREITADGLEKTLALNHLSYFLLTNLLLDLIRSSGESGSQARIVNVSSGGHSQGHMNFGDLQFERGYRSMAAYGRSKLANLLFTYELDRRLAEQPVTVNAFHPGLVGTEFARNNGLLARIAMRLVRPFLLAPEQGAETGIYLASSPAVEGVSGKYYVRKRPQQSSSESYDESVARRLWDVSMQLTRLEKTIS